MSTAITRVELRYEQDVVSARSRARIIAEQLGFDKIDQTRISTAVSEIARNAFQYAGGGEIEFLVDTSMEPNVFAITIRDHGKGIPNLDEVLEGRFASETGMGVGIIGSKRLLDHFHIDTQPGRGTTVFLGKNLPVTAPQVTQALLTHIADVLAKTATQNPFEEIRLQNQDLIRTLEELRQRQEESIAVNRELEDTNRGVVALYAELDDKAVTLTRANEALARSEERYRTLSESSPDQIFIDGRDGTIQYVNTAALKLFHLSYDQVVGKPRKDFFPPEIFKSQEASLHQVFETGESIRKEEMIQFGTEKFWIDTRLVPLKDEAGNVTSVLSIARDNTKRKKAESALLESERRLIEAQRIGKIGNWEWMPAENKVIWSAEMYDIFGIAPENVSLTMEMTMQTIHPEDRAMVAEATRKTLEDLKPHHIECRILKPDGTISYVYGRGETVLDAKGKLVKIIGIYLDITERKKAEVSLEESETYLKTIFNSAQIGLLIIDPVRHSIYDANPAAVELIGKTKNEIIRRTCHEFICPAERGKCPITDLGQNVDNSERILLTADGERVPILKTVVPILIQGRNYLLESFIDITELTQTEKALKESEEEYRSLFEHMQEGFAYCRMVYDEKGRPADFMYLNVNPAFDRIAGTKTVVGKPVTEVFPGIKEAYPSLFEIYGRVALTGEPESFELDFKPSGKLLHISVYSPEKEHFVAIFIDITERRAAEETIRIFGENLERKVAERTSELSDVNLKLMTEIEIRLDAEKQLAKTLGEKEVLLREIHHRVKNNLQIIISLLNLQSQYMTDERIIFAFRESQNRIKVMALVHEKLYQSTDISKIDLDNFIKFLGNSLLEFFGMKGKGITLTMDIKDISLAIDTAIPLGLMINELISNSLKYAFPGGRKGEISLAIHRQDHTITILFKDNGVGIPNDLDWRNAKSMGLRLVAGLVQQLQGTIELDRTAGTVFNIVVKEKE